MEELLEDLRQANRLHPVLVEGEKDERSLRKLGLTGAIERVNRGTSLLAVCEALARSHREVIVLTDWDRKGGQLARLLREKLGASGGRANLQWRRDLASLAQVRTVEGLAGWMTTLRAAAAPAGERRHASHPAGEPPPGRSGGPDEPI